MRQRIVWIGVLIVGLGLSGERASALKRFQQPARLYTADMVGRVYNIPPSVQRQYVGVKAVLTRVSWPGQSTIGVAATEADTQLVLLVGAGVLFPADAGPDPARPPRLRLESGGLFEVAHMVSRSGDVLTVVRGQGNTAAIPLSIGAKVRLLDLVYVEFERTLDGQTWERIGLGGFPGGTTLVNGVPTTSSGIAFGFIGGDGQPVAQDGDIRVRIKNRVDYTSALTLDMVEAGDL